MTKLYCDSTLSAKLEKRCDGVLEIVVMLLLSTFLAGIVQGISGMVTPLLFQYAAFCIAPILLELWIGNKIFQYIDSATFKKIVYLLMFLNG